MEVCEGTGRGGEALLESVGWVATIILALSVVSPFAKKLVFWAWTKFYHDWWNMDEIPTECRLCHKKGKRRMRLPLSGWEVVAGRGWEYYLARGAKVVRGATGGTYMYSFQQDRAEIEHFKCKALRWISRSINDSGVGNLLR